MTNRECIYPYNYPDHPIHLSPEPPLPYHGYKLIAYQEKGFRYVFSWDSISPGSSAFYRDYQDGVLQNRDLTYQERLELLSRLSQIDVSRYSDPSSNDIIRACIELHNKISATEVEALTKTP